MLQKPQLRFDFDACCALPLISFNNNNIININININNINNNNKTKIIQDGAIVWPTGPRKIYGLEDLERSCN